MTPWCIEYLVLAVGVPVLGVSTRSPPHSEGWCMCGYKYVLIHDNRSKKERANKEALVNMQFMSCHEQSQQNTHVGRSTRGPEIFSVHFACSVYEVGIKLSMACGSEQRMLNIF